MPDIAKSEPAAAPLTPRAFLPVVLSVVAVSAALLAQHLFINAAQRWRER